MINVARRAGVVCLLAALVACGGGSSGTDSSTVTSADATTTVAETTTTAGAPDTTPAPDSAPPTTAAPVVTPAPTLAPTPTPTTAACRNVGTLYGFDLDISSVNVRRGDCGQGVREIQEQLNYKLGISLAVDGRFGPGTETAVRNFQTSVGLTADGIVGPNTWVALTDDGT